MFVQGLARLDSEVEAELDGNELDISSYDKFFGISAQSMWVEDFPELERLLRKKAHANGITQEEEFSNWPSVTIDASQCGSIARCQIISMHVNAACSMLTSLETSYCGAF